jgi:hypothetical protein
VTGGCAGGVSHMEPPAHSDYTSHAASSEARPMKIVMNVWTSIADRHPLSLPRSGNSFTYTGCCIGSGPCGRDAIPALYRPVVIRQRTVANMDGG